MIDRALIKQRAKEQIRGKIGLFCLVYLIIGAITAASVITAIGPALMAIVFQISIICISFKCFYKKELKVSDCFSGFEFFGKALWLRIITQFFISMWSMLFVIPGIVKTYSYYMAPYILADNPGMTAREALRESKRITEGHKTDIFVMELSFLGWAILTVLTFGILGMYVHPYMSVSFVNLYKALTLGIETVEHAGDGRKSVCSHCRRTLLPGEICRCREERYVFESTSFCVHCGRVLHGGEVCTCTSAVPSSKFCTKCGRPLYPGEVCTCVSHTHTVTTFESDSADVGGGLKINLRESKSSGSGYKSHNRYLNKAGDID